MSTKIYKENMKRNKKSSLSGRKDFMSCLVCLKRNLSHSSGL
jgi:hypothetical protein